jgi:hypothetical protein
VDTLVFGLTRSKEDQCNSSTIEIRNEPICLRVPWTPSDSRTFGDCEGRQNYLYQDPNPTTTTSAESYVSIVDLRQISDFSWEAVNFKAALGVVL